LSLHDALPIFGEELADGDVALPPGEGLGRNAAPASCALHLLRHLPPSVAASVPVPSVGAAAEIRRPVASLPGRRQNAGRHNYRAAAARRPSRPRPRPIETT